MIIWTTRDERRDDRGGYNRDNRGGNERRDDDRRDDRDYDRRDDRDRRDPDRKDDREPERSNGDRDVEKRGSSERYNQNFIIIIFLYTQPLIVYYITGSTKSTLEFWRQNSKSGGRTLIIIHKILMLVS